MREAGLFSRHTLIADIDLARGIIPNKDKDDSWLDAGRGAKLGCLAFDLGANLIGDAALSRR